MKDRIPGFLILILILLAVPFTVFCVPFAFVWAFNTLFALGLTFNFETWLAAVIFLILFGPKLS